jgi:hypothetical protein
LKWASNFVLHERCISGNAEQHSVVSDGNEVTAAKRQDLV